MNKPNSFENYAGAKTVWIIEFFPDDQSCHPCKVSPSIQFIPTACEIESNDLQRQRIEMYVEEDEGVEGSEVFEDLCGSIEEACEKSSRHHEILKEHSQFLNEQIENLGKIVEKFHDILREFNKKEEGEL